MTHRTLIIAEAGVNHNGCLTTAKQLIDAASDAGADFIKFQTFKAESLVTFTADKADYQKRSDQTDQSQYAMLKKLELDRSSHETLVDYCRNKTAKFVSSAFDIDSIDLLVELDIPFACCVGVPGPRLPMAPQKVELIDEVCWFFPELKFVMRHGAEPWTELAVKLMLKYPNLYYMTSAFAPKHYPQTIINYANKRGSDKIMYAGYFPMGLSLERIFKELPDVPFRDDVWPKFLRENAVRVFKLND